MDNEGFADISLTSDFNGTVGTYKLNPGSMPSNHPTPKVRPHFFARLRNSMITGLETIFYRFGITIAKNPYKTIAACLIIPSLLTIGMVKFKVNEDFADLLLPPSSRIFEDRNWVEQHVSYEQRPIRMNLQNNNVLSKESLIALYDVHMQLSKLTVDADQTFETLCVRIGGLCFVDSLLALWRNDIAKIEKLTDNDIINAINTIKTNPLYLLAFNASKILGQIERNATGHIVAAGIMHADWFIQSSIQVRPTAKKLEYKAIDLALKGHAKFDEINVFTMDCFSEEFFKAVYGDIILIVYWFPLYFLYISSAMGKPNLLEHGVYLTVASVLGVLLSAGACYGVGLAAGLMFGAPHQGLIFLLLAVGVDAAFVINTTWTRINKTEKKLSIEERIAVTLQHSGVSVTVTHFSDLVAFAAGISTQMPVLRSFCIYCAIGIVFLFLMQTMMFPACLTLNQRRIEARRDGCIPCIIRQDSSRSKCSQIEILSTVIKEAQTPIILSIWGKICIILITFGLAGVMMWGISGLRKGFEIERSLPKDSFVRNFLKSQRLYFSEEGPGIQTFCGPMNYHENIAALDKMVKAYENSSVIISGLVGNWIPYYKLYVGIFYPNVVLNADKVPKNASEFYILLKSFFTTALGIPFSKYIEMTDHVPPQIKWTYFPMQQIVTQDAWLNEHIMEEVRRIADSTNLTDEGKCFCYSLFHIFTEVIRYVEQEITRSFILAGCAIFIMTLVFIVDILSSFLVLVCVCLTLIDIMGTLHFWDFYLDVNLVVLLIISIGLAVDFCAPVGYTFMTVTGTRNERTRKTLSNIGPAIIHGALTTFLVFFVLIFGKSLSGFFAVFILVVIYGVFHGVFFLPVVLSLIGPPPYYNAVSQDAKNTTVSEKDKHLESGEEKAETIIATVGNEYCPVYNNLNSNDEYHANISNGEGTKVIEST